MYLQKKALDGSRPERLAILPSHREAGLQLLQILGNEITKADKIRDADPYFRLRVLVRVLFSVIDALCSYLKGLALQSARSTGITLSNNELEVLEGAGRPPGTKKVISVTLRCYARVRNAKCPLPSSGDLPEHVSQSMAIRNRITHPKGPHDYDISKQESIILKDASDWLRDILYWVNETETSYIRGIQTKISSSIRGQIEQMEKDVNE